MLQLNKFINIRYITKEEPVNPSPKNYPLGVNDPAFRLAKDQYISDLHSGTHDTLEPPQNAIRLLSNSIDYKISLGAGVVMGLAESDLVNWYMKPVSISIKGESIISSNPMITSDNIILAMYQKLKAKLSPQNYNYYNKPLFHLYVENGLQDFNEFKGVIKSFNFDEKAKFPNKYDYSIDFEGNPYNLSDNGFHNHQKDLQNISPTAPKPSAIGVVNKSIL